MSTEAVMGWIDSTDLYKFALATENHVSVTEDSYDEKHEEWCCKLQSVSYGRAAKVIAIYIKTMIIIPSSPDLAICSIAHPPIDTQVLKGLARYEELRQKSRSYYNSIAWTKLDKDGYQELIRRLRIDLPGQPMWALDRFWNGYKAK